MMQSVNQLLKTISKNSNIRQDIIEKDYALSYLLEAISATDGLNNDLVLKGGTALNKLYFPGYRFSEDLDFSTRKLGPVDDIDNLMKVAVDYMTDALLERGPFQVSLEPLTLKQAHPGEQKAYIIRVQFPGQRQALCRLKVEITIDEPILSQVRIRPIIHRFEEDFSAESSVYSLEEITAEKLRALLQSKARLVERGWGASRVCRDYYDLWSLLQVPEIDSSEILVILKQKCEVRYVTYSSAQDFISDDLLSVARIEWPQQLLPFVNNAPDFELLIGETQNLIKNLWC